MMCTSATYKMVFLTQCSFFLCRFFSLVRFLLGLTCLVRSIVIWFGVTYTNVSQVVVLIIVVVVVVVIILVEHEVVVVQ